ncbi:hypothetical protein LS482_17080 [Sinomicrobium kalidii]|uniref:sporulation-delaying protein SdpB family protein n=1 Tax=Sinomicrobium kalidii TaxID=2900738 RepID=UPI001E5411B7|nr:sporulation-delaying protein SdpB family protein [Sinomicrobium kalidii]UGU15383.1 hypothetical protein LS482_17080 [Sinomicrobium kalidii]
MRIKIIQYINKSNYKGIICLYSLARTCLAIGILITLLFDSPFMLFPEDFFRGFDKTLFVNQINFFYLFEYENLLWAKWIAILILLTVIFGIFPRITALLHWWIAFSYNTGTIVVDGGDQITSILTLMIIPIALFDNRRSHWNDLKDENSANFIGKMVSISTLVLCQIQMSIIYFFAGVEKMKVQEWIDGSAVYYWFNHNIFGANSLLRYLFEDFFKNQFFVISITWGVMLLEILLFAACFMNRKNKYIFFIIGISFHFVILLTHGLISFFFAMAGGLILYLLPSKRAIEIMSNIRNYDTRLKLHSTREAKI